MKNIRKRKVISLWKRPGRRGFSEHWKIFIKFITWEATGIRVILKCLSTAMCLLMLINARFYYIILFIHVIFQKEYLTYCCTLSSPLWTVLNDILPALLWLCSLFPSRWEGKQLQTDLLQWQQTPWLSLFQSGYGYPSNQSLFFSFSFHVISPRSTS